MSSVELLEQQQREFREDSEAAVETHRSHIGRQTSATIKEGHHLLRKLKLAERDEQRAHKREPLQDTPVTSRMPPLGTSVQRAAIESYRDAERKRKSNMDYDAAAIALGGTVAFNSSIGTPLAQYRMTQQQHQLMMYQQAMQQQNMVNSQWMSAHSTPPYAMPSQNAWP